MWPNDGYALRGEGLRAALEEDKEAGLKPFVLSESRTAVYSILATFFTSIVATVGTTSSGAIDNIPEIATIRE